MPTTTPTDTTTTRARPHPHRPWPGASVRAVSTRTPRTITSTLTLVSRLLESDVMRSRSAMAYVSTDSGLSMTSRLEGHSRTLAQARVIPLEPPTDNPEVAGSIPALATKGPGNRASFQPGKRGLELCPTCPHLWSVEGIPSKIEARDSWYGDRRRGDADGGYRHPVPGWHGEARHSRRVGAVTLMRETAIVLRSSTAGANAKAYVRTECGGGCGAG
jgi:hypothetical protein